MNGGSGGADAGPQRLSRWKAPCSAVSFAGRGNAVGRLMDGSAPHRDVGVTVLPEFFQNEGVEAVLDNIVHRAGATSVATSPYVMEPADPNVGSREPPADGAAGKVRLLDRPLWGRRELWVRTAPSFTHDASLYAGLRYQPTEPDALTDRDGKTVGEAIRSAKSRGLRAHLQIQAAIPPGYRVQFGGAWEDDQPRLPDGTAVPGRLDNNGSLASPHLLAYTGALLRDLARAYPEIDAIRLDWPEYPPYELDSFFTDFSDYACALTAELGFDPERMRLDVQWLRGEGIALLAERGQEILAGDAGRYALLRLLSRRPGIFEWLLAKSAIVTRFISHCAAVLHDESDGRIGLIPQVFPPPWSIVSGFDAAAVGRTGVQAIGVKLYTMHWPMMLRSYGETIRAREPDSAELGPLLAALLGTTDAEADQLPLDRIRYPEPDEPHLAGPIAQAAKIRAVRAEAGAVPVYAFAHGYGPLADVSERIEIAYTAASGRIWVNRYGYLSDDKLTAIGRVTGLPGAGRRA